MSQGKAVDANEVVTNAAKASGDSAQVKPANAANPDPLTAPTLDATPAGTGPEVNSVFGKSLVGTTIDDFELLEELGRGGMGVVYKARQISLDRPVAVKMLLAEHFENQVVLTRFLGEARAVAALDHPDIVKIYQIGQCAHGHYFAMEYIDGKALESFVAKGPLPVHSAVALMIPLARAIDYAHSKGIIHRDLKPGNIMLRQLRRPVVMDFGIAKVTGKSSSVTQQGVVVGTPSYMSPEQAQEGTEPVGPRSDVYSLGAILYATLTGHAPFEEKTALSTILRVISPEAPRPLRALRPEVPAALEQICMKALAKNPTQRYASAGALAEDLRRFRVGQTTQVSKAEATSTPPASPTATPPPSRLDLSALAEIESPALRVALVMKATGKTIRLDNLVTVVGRASDCDVILRSSDVSKRHCQIVLEDQQVWVEDLDSANGTFVNGKQIKRCQLKNGDRVDVSSHSFQVRIASARKA